VLAISDRPLEIHRDGDGRLHNQNGPSMIYRDGWSLWHWRGVAVPQEWIMDRAKLTAKTALTWTNMEQRRIACSEILGWAKILKELDAKIIDKDGDPQIGTLVEVSLPDLRGPARFCLVQCGTGREFAVGVPRDIPTAIAAQAWMQGIELREFQKPEIRT
jgi:hypothetical protein